MTNLLINIPTIVLSIIIQEQIYKKPILFLNKKKINMLKIVLCLYIFVVGPAPGLGLTTSRLGQPPQQGKQSGKTYAGGGGGE